MRWLRIPVPTLALAAAVVAAACSDSTSPNQPEPPSATYALTSLTQSGTSLSPPLVTGQIVLAKPNYSVRIDITVPTPDSIIDAGTYSFSTPDKVVLNSDSLGVALSGTYTYNASTGALSVTIPSQSLRLNAQKQ